MDQIDKEIFEADYPFWDLKRQNLPNLASTLVKLQWRQNDIPSPVHARGKATTASVQKFLLGFDFFGWIVILLEHLLSQLAHLGEVVDHLLK